MDNVLKKIIDNKKEKITNYKKKYSSSETFDRIKEIKYFINFNDRLKKRYLEKKISIIAEIKKASPSSGLIVKNFNHLEIAKS